MKVLVVGVVALVALLVGSACVSSWLMNPRVVRELREEPDGERAKRVMLLSLPSGKEIPVNYIRDGDTVYAAADFPWWRELREGGRVSVLVRGETLSTRFRVRRRSSTRCRLRRCSTSSSSAR